jgi:hypothetical protein
MEKRHPLLRVALFCIRQDCKDLPDYRLVREDTYLIAIDCQPWSSGVFLGYVSRRQEFE